jgi:hypothetical protein
LAHRLSRDRRRYREALSRIKNTVQEFRRRQEAEGKPRPALLDFGPKTVGELKEFSDAVGRALRRAARKTARMHGTSVYFWKNGKVVAEKP